jgi:hypothetical protein
MKFIIPVDNVAEEHANSNNPSGFMSEKCAQEGEIDVILAMKPIIRIQSFFIFYVFIKQTLRDH